MYVLKGRLFLHPDYLGILGFSFSLFFVSYDIAAKEPRL